MNLSDLYDELHTQLCNSVREDPEKFVKFLVDGFSPAEDEEAFDFSFRQKLVRLEGVISSGVQVIGKALLECPKKDLKDYLSETNGRIQLKGYKVWTDFGKGNENFDPKGISTDPFFQSILSRYNSEHVSTIHITQQLVSRLSD